VRVNEANVTRTMLQINLPKNVCLCQRFFFSVKVSKALGLM
jgi:hypothetical protein